MDIIKPTSLDFNRLAGKLAVKWGDCSAINETMGETYDAHVIPYVEKVIEPMFNIVEHVERFPATARKPYTYVINGTSEDWKVAKATINERIKPQSTRKDFEEAKRTGKIALRPLLNCKILGSATPKIIPSTPPVDTGFMYKYTEIGAQTGSGVCRKSWNTFPELECDVFANGTWVKQLYYQNATTIPISETELSRIMQIVKSRLDSIPPDEGLVTQVVSEANSATWDIATEIAEMPETIGYILNGIKQGILLLLRAKRDIKQQLSKGFVTDVASIWMQYRYALMPIVYGVNDALDVLGMDAVKFQSFRGRMDTPLFDTSEVGGYAVKGMPTFNNRVFLKYKYDVDSSIHQGLQINFATTAWELLPLSFVFDWFFQVGDYLTAAFQPGVVTDYGCQQSVRCKGSLILEGYSSETFKIDIDYYRCRNIDPNAFIGINSDVFISFKRAMDALALSWLLFGKKNRRG